MEPTRASSFIQRYASEALSALRDKLEPFINSGFGTEALHEVEGRLIDIRALARDIQNDLSVTQSVEQK